MKTIYLLGFGSGEKGEITLRTLDILINSDLVFVRTTKHPASEILEDYRISYQSFDSIYDSASDFDEVYATIAETVLSADADIVSYIVPGSAVFAEKAVQYILQNNDCNVTIIPAVSFLDGIFSCLKQDALQSYKLLDALQLNTQEPDVSCMNIICQVYDRDIASDVKLALMDYYTDQTEVILITAAATSNERILKLPLYEIDHVDTIDHLTSLIIPPQPYRNTLSAFRSLQTIVSELRGENGCSWDKAQTHASLARYLIEESYEVIDAIEEDNPPHLCEELGDVLLQVFLHAQIAGENDHFHMSDVIRTVSEKMLRRHPHVFGDEDGNQDLNALWEKIKQEEQSHETVSEKLSSIAKSLPSLIYAQKIQSHVAKVGFDFGNAQDAFSKILEETVELREAVDQGLVKEIQMEGGDLIFAVINVLRLCGIQSEQALRGAIEKFVFRFNAMEQMLLTDNKQIDETDPLELDHYWNLAKNS